MDRKNFRMAIFGSGAIGGALGAWIAPHLENLYMLDKGEVAAAMKAKGLSVYMEGHKAEIEKVKVKVVDDISEIPDVECIVISVKNYSLDAVAKSIREKVKGEPIIIAMQNGIENQRILPKYFKNIIYCVISFNAWMDEPGVVGYQKKGPFILGTPDNSLQKEMKEIAELMSMGVETVVTDHLLDAAHSKMIINLTNSFTTLVGHRFREISSYRLFKKILTNLTYEGMQIVKANGYKECKLGGMPSWRTLTAAVKLPDFLTDGTFKKNLNKMVLSSMGQDILLRKGTDSEIDTLNGYFINLADKAGLKVPYNRAVYELCKQEFSKPDFTPLDVTEVWDKVKEKLS